ncbi:MAG TPA: tetratricopeptide repeat protein [Candidatus Polarisedimenticolia bacterium]|nr:tetratricopeptide repeat protein [Candidatus Polarisedimenticolia bacterium]
MAIDRNKISQAAEKLVAQGKIDQAIAQFELLVRDNPRDMNAINKIGDLYSRIGKKREAILQYNKIGEFYAKDGFFLKAIAIYKKINKLDPSHLDAYQRLAELYEKQGLVLEARSQYQFVAQQSLRAGDVKRAIAVNEALVAMDPSDLKQRAALADLKAGDGRAPDAAEDYVKIGAELEEKGRTAEARSAYEKAASLHPGSPAMVLRLAESRRAGGDAESALKMVKDALKKSESPDLLILQGDLHLDASRCADAIASFDRAAALAPQRGEAAVKGARARLAAGDAAGAIESLAPRADALLKQGLGKEAAAVLEEAAEADEGSHVLRVLMSLHEALKDDQRLLRAGSRLALRCLEAGETLEGGRIVEKLLAMRPGDPGLEELRVRLRPSPAQAAAPAAQGGRDPDSAPLREKGSAAGELPEAPRIEPEDEDFITEHMTEADVFVKYGLGDRAVEQLQAVIDKYPGYAPAFAKLKELYLEEGNRDGARRQMASLVRAHLAAGDRQAAAEALEELSRFDPASPETAALQGLVSGGPAAAAHRAAQAPSAASESAPAPAEEEPAEPEPPGAELAQIDRLLAAGNRSEAVQILRRLAESCGSHPAIVSRMRQAVSMSAQAAAGPAAAARSPVHHADHEEEFEIGDAEDEALHVQTAAQAPSVSGSDGPADLMDLASEIDAALSGASSEASALVTGEEASPEGHSLEEIVQAFKKGVEQQVGADDFETHYNLAIAYKEMGLLDEAIGEFQFAAKEPKLLLDCCSMLGICFREKRMGPLAVKWYRKGLEAAEGRDEETVLGLRYDLAALLAELGEHREAMELFTEVYGNNSQFRDVAARIKELQRAMSR